MDILKQYNQQFPEANKPAPQWQPPEEYGAVVRLAIKLSGGRIRDEKQANAVLIAVAIVFFILTAWLLFFSNSSTAGENLLKKFPPGTSVLKPLKP